MLRIGIVGLPNVGKSTLFNALTQNSVPAENYPFCTIDPSVGVVGVPDYRLQTLTQLSNSAQTIPAAVEFVDIAGLVRGASAGEGLGNAFLANIREVDMIVEMVRIFEDENVHHVNGAVDPMQDIEVINLELILSDAETISKRITNLEKEAKRGNKEGTVEKELLTRLLRHLESGKLANNFDTNEQEATLVRRLQLLTAKPILYVCNKKNDAYNLDEMGDERWQELTTFFNDAGHKWIAVDAATEHELKDLSEEEKNEFRREYGSQETGLGELIKSAYATLSLISFFTTGEKETRAWTTRLGSAAPTAGAAIHTDFRDKFIRAHVVSYADLIAAGSIAEARERGKLRTEGKEYIVQDGDVLEFLHS